MTFNEIRNHLERSPRKSALSLNESGASLTGAAVHAEFIFFNCLRSYFAVMRII